MATENESDPKPWQGHGEFLGEMREDAFPKLGNVPTITLDGPRFIGHCNGGEVWINVPLPKSDIDKFQP
jgi:hypothetical protein